MYSGPLHSGPRYVCKFGILHFVFSWILSLLLFWVAEVTAGKQKMFTKLLKIAREARNKMQNLREAVNQLTAYLNTFNVHKIKVDFTKVLAVFGRNCHQLTNILTF